MSKYKFDYTGKTIAEWDYNGKHYEAREYEDGFNYICEYEDGYLSNVGDTAYAYFFGDNWLPLAKKLGVYK